MTQKNIMTVEMFWLNPNGFGCYLFMLSLTYGVCVFPFRLRCATISADRNTDGQVTIAKATFNGSVTGTIRLVGATIKTFCKSIPFVFSTMFRSTDLLIQISVEHH